MSKVVVSVLSRTFLHCTDAVIRCKLAEYACADICSFSLFTQACKSLLGKKGLLVFVVFFMGG